mgnify:CR=1 FL=1
MSIIKKTLKYLTSSDYRFIIKSNKGGLKKMPDDEFLKRKFKVIMGKTLDLENPKTFNEKLQWLKLYNRRPEYTQMVDKYEVKKYISDIIGKNAASVFPDAVDEEIKRFLFVSKITLAASS